MKRIVALGEARHSQIYQRPVALMLALMILHDPEAGNETVFTRFVAAAAE